MYYTSSTILQQKIVLYWRQPLNQKSAFLSLFLIYAQIGVQNRCFQAL